MLDQINVEKSGRTKNKLEGKDRKIIFGWEVNKLDCVKLGIPRYDNVIGGEPRGRITIDYGVESSGKSTWNYFKMGVLQKLGLTSLVVDMENSFDPEWCAAQGVDLSSKDAPIVVIKAQRTLEDTLEHVVPIIETGQFDFVLVDSIHGVGALQEVGKDSDGLDSDLAKDSVAAGARRISKFMRMITGPVAKSNVIMTIIGQARSDVGPFASDVTLTGGHALKHGATCIRQWTRAGKDYSPERVVDGKKAVVGSSSRIRIEKTKINGNERQQIIIPFLYGYGPAKVQMIVEEAMAKGVLQVAGAWFKWPSKSKDFSLQGSDSLYQHFEENKEDLKLLQEHINQVQEESDVKETKENA